MVVKFNLVIFRDKNSRSGTAKRAIGDGEIQVTGELFLIVCSKTLVQICLLHLLTQGLAVNPEYFRSSCPVAADV